MVSVLEKQYKYCPNCRTVLSRKTVDGRQLLACPKCDFIFWNDPIPAVSVVLYKNNRALLLKRNKEPLRGGWCLPGGFMHYDETPEETAVRETKEETSTKVKIDRLVGVYRIDNDPRGVHIDIVYCAKFNGKVILSNEHQDYKFCYAQKLPKNVLFKHRQATLDWYNKSTNST